MVVMEGPEPGYNTDVMVWRDCQIRLDLEQIMQARQALVPPLRRLKLYADKIYNTGPLITAAFSERHGPLQQWMQDENYLMSKIRVAVEWTFKTILMLFKFTSFSKGQKILEARVPNITLYLSCFLIVILVHMETNIVNTLIVILLLPQVVHFFTEDEG